MDLPSPEAILAYFDRLQAQHEAMKDTPMGQAMTVFGIVHPGFAGPEMMDGILTTPRLFATSFTPMSSPGLGLGCSISVMVYACAIGLQGQDGDIARARAELGTEIGLAIAT